ncbi:hypothetical protein P153DRAFT_363593 [Dothidotthia symphoricarpi CBS 119687]|uniref:Myb-like domain-containing protein n=1 Tax=Dothidotthia symphoricarpi CBS 119687 TaxID=1392245 RepID=A0A6A6ARC7_9PLEO|nr:uncharacterized protein P153DRAFT_363593 [Dothidotthia symphoricarpi CBS 119687]KAF2133397.1 hypothetical protein P153DRAFT_363593 [Dothidotthia symphoricarpi CBS 119687]
MARKTKQKPAKKTVDLTTVEELDTQIDLGDAPGTPPRTQFENTAPDRSPGAASQMSGTTAMPSFSQIEDEALDSEAIMKHLRKLGNAAEDFLDHIVPDNGGQISDLRNLEEIQNPNSRFLEGYQEFDNELNEYLKDFKSQEQDYINVQGIHHALFDVDEDAAAVQTDLDSILYLTNLAVFAKRMIHPDLSQKDIWDALRQLDMSFPSHFVPSFSAEGDFAAGGQSALLKKTFKLALEMRTQLAVMVMQRSLNDSSFDPDRVIDEVFLNSEASQEPGRPAIRGWSDTALGEKSDLSRRFQSSVLKRIEVIRKYFPMDAGSLERGEKVLIEDLVARFPWDGGEGFVVQLLDWTRFRYRELRTAIEKLGGAAAIVRNVKKERDSLQPATQTIKVTPALQETLRRKRSSFGPDRRRSSRRFDPNAPVDIRAIDALKARERASEIQEADVLPETQPEPETQADPEVQADAVAPQTFEETREEETVLEDEQDDWQTTLAEDDLQVDKQLVKEAEQSVEEIIISGPPKIDLDLVKNLIAASQPEKENRDKPRFVDRQPNAQRVDFGDGFSSQISSGPSNIVKEKQSAPPPSRKRARSADEDDDSDAFETEERTARVQERRQKAPVAKKVRLDPELSAPPTSRQPPRPTPASSGAPPSHQPPRRNDAPDDEDESSETDPPDMTEEAPASTYEAQKLLAKQNDAVRPRGERKPRTAWTEGAEKAFVNYMAKYPQKYSTIMALDEPEKGGHGWFQDRTQVSLKDKAVVMAVNMIKSGTGLREGFENVVRPWTKIGEGLSDAGYKW